MDTRRQRGLVALTAVALVAVACSGRAEGSGGAAPLPAPEASATETPATPDAPQAPPQPPGASATPDPVDPRVTVLGPEEFVFVWSTDRCDDEMRPDLPTRAFRTSDGHVNLTLADPTNFRLVGPSRALPPSPLVRAARKYRVPGGPPPTSPSTITPMSTVPYCNCSEKRE